MKIKMTKTMMGSANGCVTTAFEAGKTYDLGDEPRALELGAVFLREKVAVEFSPEIEAAEAKAAEKAQADAEKARADAREAKKAADEAKKLADAEAILAKRKRGAPAPAPTAPAGDAPPDPKPTAPQK